MIIHFFTHQNLKLGGEKERLKVSKVYSITFGGIRIWNHLLLLYAAYFEHKDYSPLKFKAHSTRSHVPYLTVFGALLLDPKLY